MTPCLTLTQIQLFRWLRKSVTPKHNMQMFVMYFARKWSGATLYSMELCEIVSNKIYRL